MNNIKCPQCGLVNFASASECKRCHFEFRPQQPEFVPPPALQPALAQTPYQTVREVPFEPLPIYEPVATPIGGWLIVFAIYLVLVLGASLFCILYTRDIMSSREYYVMTTPGNMAYIEGLSSGMTFEFIRVSLIGLAAVLLLVRFFRKSSSLPGFATGFFALFIASGIIEFFIAVHLEGKVIQKFGPLLARANVTEVVPPYVYLGASVSLLLATAWLIYIRASRRVESTFIY